MLGLTVSKRKINAKTLQYQAGCLTILSHQVYSLLSICWTAFPEGTINVCTLVQRLQKNIQRCMRNNTIDGKGGWDTGPKKMLGMSVLQKWNWWGATKTSRTRCAVAVFELTSKELLFNGNVGRGGTLNHNSRPIQPYEKELFDMFLLHCLHFFVPACALNDLFIYLFFATRVEIWRIEFILHLKRSL